jgi:hypothetical protein
MKKEIPILTGLLITVIVLVVYQIISYNKFKAELEECQTELAICQGNATTTDAIKHETVKLDLDGWTTIKTLKPINQNQQTCSIITLHNESPTK